MYVCMYACMYACMHVYIYMHVYIHAYMHTCIHTCIHALIHTCIHIRTYVHTCISLFSLLLFPFSLLFSANSLRIAGWRTATPMASAGGKPQPAPLQKPAVLTESECGGNAGNARLQSCGRATSSSHVRELRCCRTAAACWLTARDDDLAASRTVVLTDAPP